MGKREQEYGVYTFEASRQQISILGKIIRLVRNTK